MPFTPVQVPGLQGVTALVAGYSYSVALRSDGTVWSWGSNENAELGDGTRNDDPNPNPVQALNLTGVTAIAAGDKHSLALRSDGSVWAWGRNWQGQLGDGTRDWRFLPGPVSLTGAATRIAAAGEHSFAIRGPEGLVSSWGHNLHGQLGNGEAGYYPTPGPVLFP